MVGGTDPEEGGAPVAGVVQELTPSHSTSHQTDWQEVRRDYTV